ncbi:hypothetical protein J3R83DRAFT_5209 [Lanmaoa asiatica]|nr:hypothetical protein J3R83DRAFT_5209 [Lanmaoa asiatica]
MSDPTGKQERVEEFLRNSLLGEELVNTQFHLYSARSSPSGRVLKPRVLCANNVLLAKSSKYFLDLLSSDINPSDPSLIDLTDDNDVPSNALIDDYGYGSDSDLDDCNDPIPVANVEAPKNQPATSSTTPSKTSAKTEFKDDDELSDDDSDSDSSDLFVMSPEQPRADDLFPVNKDGARSVASSETAVHGTLGNKTLANQTAIRLRSLGSRHVLVKDTAFQTWYTLLNYLYTDKFNFLPLSSATPGGQPHESSTSSLDEPKCSAKSMYRLTCKAKHALQVGLDELRDEAFSYIRSNLTEHNILKELSCSLVSRHPQLLEMELDVLYSHIASPPVVANFSALAQRIANKELPHGADIIVGVHARLLKEPHPLPLKPAVPTSRPGFLFRPPDAVGDKPEAEKEEEAGPSCGYKSGAGESIPSAQPVRSAFTTLWGVESMGGERKATEKEVPRVVPPQTTPTFSPTPPISNMPKGNKEAPPPLPPSIYGFCASPQGGKAGRPSARK